MQLRLASPQATFVNQGVASVDESDSYDIETLGGDLRNPIKLSRLVEPVDSPILMISRLEGGRG